MTVSFHLVIEQCMCPFETENWLVKRSKQAILVRFCKILARLGHSHFAHLIQVKETTVHLFKMRQARLEGEMVKQCFSSCAC